MIIDTDIILKYTDIHEKVCKLFESGKLERKTFYDLIEMERHTFTRKIKQRSFSSDELLKLAKAINNTFKIN